MRFPGFAILATIGFLTLSIGGQRASAQADPAGDYGDAPDGAGAETYYTDMFPTTSERAKFPTEYNTLNSRIGQPGAHHQGVGQEWFGKEGLIPSVEAGASDGSDPDGFPNLVNSDGADDGLPEIPFFISLTSLPPSATLTFFVSVDAGAPAGPRYVNVLIDWDQNGVWENTSIPGTGTNIEWIAQDFAVNVPPGTTQAVSVPFTWGWNALLAPQMFWVRMTMTRTPVGATGYNYLDANGCWDGSGAFAFGETEDYLFHPDLPRKEPGGGPGPGVPSGAGGGGGSGPGGPWVTIKAKPKSQRVAHGVLAYVDIVKVPPDFVNPAGPPSTDRWEVDWGQRGNWLMTYSGQMNLKPPSPTTTQYTDPNTGSVGEFHDPPIPGGPPGTLWTFTVDSTVHPVTPSLEVWPINVRVRWPGLLVKTVHAIVEIRHSGAGVFGLHGCCSHLVDVIYDSPLPETDRGGMVNNAEAACDAFLAGDYPTAQALLQTLEDEVKQPANQAVLEAEERGAGTSYAVDSFFDITYHIDFLQAEIATIDATTGPLPVPVIETPQTGSWARGMVGIKATSMYTPVDEARFERWDNTLEDWVLLGTDTNPADGWSLLWDTTTVDDSLYGGMVSLRVVLVDENSGDPKEGWDMIHVRVDNTPPEIVSPPMLDTPPDPNVVGEATFTVQDVPPDLIGSCEIQLSSDPGGDFVTLGRDLFLEDGVEVTIDTSQLREGPYLVRAAAKDEAGNPVYSLDPPVTIEVHPSYPSWKRQRGIIDDDVDEDRDGIPAIWEYFYNMDPSIPDFPPGYFTLSPLTSGDGLLHARRREWFSGLTIEVKGSPSPGDPASWTLIETDPPLQSSGEIEVPVDMTDPSRFFRMNATEK